MFCSKCGTKALEGDAFCASCGAPLRSAAAPETIEASDAAVPVSVPGSDPEPIVAPVPAPVPEPATEPATEPIVAAPPPEPVVDAGAPGSPTSVAVSPAAYLGVLGCLAAGGGAALPWLKGFGAGADAFELPLGILLDSESPALEIGWALIAFAAFAVLLTVTNPRSKPTGLGLSGLGVLCLVVVGLFIFRVNQNLEGFSLTDVLDSGVWVAGVGAIVMILAGRFLRSR